MNCTFLDTGIPGETKEEFIERLKNDSEDERKESRNIKIDIC